jgi:hypothetical protein
MAIGKASNFVINDDLFDTIFIEQINQNVNAFNVASANSIRFVTQMLEGDYAKTRFFDRLTGGVARRDTTSVSAATDTALTQDEVISVKCSRGFGPYAQTLDAFEKAQISSEQMTSNLAIMFADEFLKDALNTGLTAGVAALSQTTGGQDLTYDYSGTGNLSHAALIAGRAKMGDAFGRIKAWVMHSKAYHDLVAAQVSVASGNVADFAIYEGNAGTLGLPVVVTDSASLVLDATTDNYYTLGLTDNAIVVQESENRRMVSDLITGLDNLVMRVQGEHAYNVEVKGFKWDTTNGGTNPTSGTIGTGTNWDSVVADDKDKGGVVIQTT